MTGMDITAPPGSGIAVVTGVSTGTGRATARAFARGSTLVVAIGRVMLDAHGRPDVLVDNAGIVRGGCSAR